MNEVFLWCNALSCCLNTHICMACTVLWMQTSLRLFAMPCPNMKVIVEAQLYRTGFSQHKILAAKLTALFRMLQTQVSLQYSTTTALPHLIMCIVFRVAFFPENLETRMSGNSKTAGKYQGESKKLVHITTWLVDKKVQLKLIAYMYALPLIVLYVAPNTDCAFFSVASSGTLHVRTTCSQISVATCMRQLSCCDGSTSQPKLSSVIAVDGWWNYERSRTVSSIGCRLSKSQQLVLYPSILCFFCWKYIN